MKYVAWISGILLLASCSSTFLSDAELERRLEHSKQAEPTPTPVPWNNKDPRKGKVQLDKHCGFWSCQETYMQCYGSVLIITPAKGTAPTRIPNAEECKP